MDTNPDPEQQLDLSIVMPAYNEEDNIAYAVGEVQEKVLALVEHAQLLIIDDGSKDRTGQIIDELAGKDARVKVIHKANSGHGPSLIEGMKAASGSYIFLIDSDLQIPLDCFAQLWEKAKNKDCVFGTRQQRQDPYVRVALSQVIRAAILTFFSTDAPDVNAPCKILRREVWQSFRAAIPADDILAPSILLNIFARRHGYSVEAVPVPHRSRARGTSTLNLRRLIPFCWQGFNQLMHYRSRLL
jgi:glycosyltransferase involved in cell wall biosynthesis